MLNFLMRRLRRHLARLFGASVLIYLLLILLPGGPLNPPPDCPQCRHTPRDNCGLGNLFGLNAPLQVERHAGRIVAICRPYPWYEWYARWLFDPDKKGGINLTIGPLH